MDKGILFLLNLLISFASRVRPDSKFQKTTQELVKLTLFFVVVFLSFASEYLIEFYLKRVKCNCRC